LITSAYGDLPFILIIDTAFERGERVTRDDGGFLGELAAAVRGRNIFLGVALDDDIAGADGANSAISRSFVIDYLDQEHLYKVVNGHIFPKHSQMQPVLHDVYTYFRDVLPDFRWSEQRFSLLYPLHPAILEIAPFVRLYVHDFALFGFAADAGERILGRPANSLIALDEVFDNAESALRKVADLREVFDAYDDLNSRVVSKIPVMQRLQAKLVLKALLLLSLNGQGHTAGEICAGMLIFDEAEPAKAKKTVQDLLTNFADAAPEQLQSETVPEGETRYQFQVVGKDDLGLALTRAVDEDDPAEVDTLLQRKLAERYNDFLLVSADEADSGKYSENEVVWRGSIRRGRVYWDDVSSKESGTDSNDTDWNVFIDRAGSRAFDENASLTAASRLIWKPDALRNDEIETIHRFRTLARDAGLRNTFSDQVAASLHAYNLSVNRIFTRSFFDDGKLVIDGFDYNFSDEAKTAPTLSQALSIMLEPLFEMLYPDHPQFTQVLGTKEVATLVADLYSGNRQYLAEVQRLASAFALPLGLVRDQGGVFAPQTEENLLQLPVPASILKMVDDSSPEPLLLSTISSELGKAPYGLVSEAQQLILAALVAQRQIEFVTGEGDRISRRSLDLQIIWSDIAAVARPTDSAYSTKKLNRWGVVFAGASGFRSLDDLADREMLRTAFLNWTAEWRRARVLEKFEAIPDDQLNTPIWDRAVHASKTLGSVAENMSSCLDGLISYEECLTRVADVVLDQPDEIEKSLIQLEVVDSFVKGAALREQIETYLALCGWTGVDELEVLRERLLEYIDRSYMQPSDANNRELGYTWTKFLREYSEHFLAEHDRVMGSETLKQSLNQIMRGEEWWQLSSLSSIASASNEPSSADALRQELTELGCGENTASLLETRPFCTCSFSLVSGDKWDRLPDRFSRSIEESMLQKAQIFRENRTLITHSLDRLASETKDDAVTTATSTVRKWLEHNGKPEPLSPLEIHILRKAVKLDQPDLNPSPDTEPGKHAAITDS